MEDDPGSFLHHGGIGGHVKGHHCVGADAGVVTYGNVADDLGTRTDIDVVADGGCSLPPAVGEGIGADGHLLENGTILAQLCAVGDKNAVKTVLIHRFLYALVNIISKAG